MNAGSLILVALLAFVLLAPALMVAVLVSGLPRHLEAAETPIEV